MCWIMLASPSKCLFLLNDPDWTNNIVLCTWRKTKPIPLLCDAHFEELSNPGKCPGGKIVFCQRVKYISTIGDILIQGYLMLMDALQNL